MNYYKADMDIDDSFSATYLSLISKQRKTVNRLMNEGVIVSYALSMDRGKLWVVFDTKSREHVQQIIENFPLAPYLRYSIYELAFYDSIHAGFPYPSLN